MGGISNAIAGWLGLNDPALTQQYPNPAYSPRVAQAANAIHQGLGALDQAIPPEAHMLGAAVPGNLGDMGIWGAAKMAKGVTEYGPWAQEMMQDADPSIEPYLPEMYQDSRKILDTHLEKTANQLPNTKKLLTMYKQGIEGQDWYAHTRDELEQHFGPDTDQFIDFLAATSPNNTVAGNVTQALKAYQQYKSGQPFTGFLPAHIDMLNKAVAEEPFGGLKVSSFTQNLKGDPIAVTVDRWMGRALGMGEKFTDPQYKFADYLITQAAHAKGIEPRQMQAAIWKTIKDSEGIAGQTGASFETVLNQKLAKDPALAAALAQARGAIQQGAGYADGGLYQRMRSNMLSGLGYAQGGPIRMQGGGFWSSLFDPTAMDRWAEADKAQLRRLSDLAGGGVQPQPLVSPQSGLGRAAQALNPQNPNYGMAGALTGMIGSQFGGGEGGPSGIAGEKFEGTVGAESASDFAQRQAEAASGRKIGQMPMTLGQQGAGPSPVAAPTAPTPMPGLPDAPTPPAPTLPSKIPRDFGPISSQPFQGQALPSNIGGGAAIRPPVNLPPSSDPRWAQMQQQINTGLGNLLDKLSSPGYEPRTAPPRGRRPNVNVQGDEPIPGWNVYGDPLGEAGYAEGGLYHRMRSNLLHSLR